MKNPFSRPSDQILVVVFFILVGATVVFQSFAPESIPVVKNTIKACKGEPLHVEYPYEGDFLEPHACEIQCDDQIQRYIVYTNGKATQCEQLPGCLDWGEDQGVTCSFQEASSSS